LTRAWFENTFTLHLAADAHEPSAVCDVEVKLGIFPRPRRVCGGAFFWQPPSRADNQAKPVLYAPRPGGRAVGYFRGARVCDPQQRSSIKRDPLKEQPMGVRTLLRLAEPRSKPAAGGICENGVLLPFSTRGFSKSTRAFSKTARRK
jgi:hypothetical protein